MSSFPFPVFPDEFFDAHGTEFDEAGEHLPSFDPTATALRVVIKMHWDIASEAANALGVVQQAEANAIRQLETSDNPAAVKYRDLKERATAAREAANKELQAALQLVRDEFAAKNAPLNEVGKKIEEHRRSAIDEIAQSLAAGIKTDQLTTSYDQSVKALKGMLTAVETTIPGSEFKLPTSGQIIRGGKTVKDGEREGWRPRYNKIIVDGQEVPPSESKTGKLTVTFTDAAKLARQSSGQLLKRLNESMGNAFSWDAVSLTAEGGYTFTGFAHKGNPAPVIEVFPKLANADEEDQDLTEDEAAEVNELLEGAELATT